MTDATPYEKYYGKRPSIGHIRIFGCITYVKVQNKKRSGYQKKTEERSRKGILVGYEQDHTYRVYILDDKKVTITRDVIFDESGLVESDTNYDHLMLRQEEDSSELTSSDEEEVNIIEENEEEPNTYEEAMSSPEAREWKSAMDEEYESLVKNKTWALVDLPPGKQLISARWVYKLKQDGGKPKYKARFVARGFSQRRGIDYNETYSPVARADSIRALLNLAAQFDWKIMQIDIKTAFLNGELEEEQYMVQPRGYEKGDKVCRLLKSIYGLKQASKQWNLRFTKFLIKNHLKQMKSDSCIFTSSPFDAKSEKMVAICIYVDDGLLFANNENLLNVYIKKLGDEFDMRFGPVQTFVGMEIEFKEGCISIKQANYIRKIITRFGMNAAKPAITPIDSNVKLSKTGTNGVESKRVQVPYRNIIGSLLYAAMGTRPDICFSVNLLSRFCEEPRMIHWRMAKNVLRYLIGKEEAGIVCHRSGDCMTIECYADSDHAGCQDTRRSTSG